MVAEPPVASRLRWALVIALPLCSSAVLWYGFSIGLLLPAMSRDLGLTHGQEGALSSAFFVGQLIFSLPASPFLSRLPPVRTMAVVFALTTLFLIAATVLPGYYAQVAARFGIAVLFVAINPVRTLLLGALFDRQDIPQANSLFNAAFGLVQGTAFWAAGPLLQFIGSWRAMLGLFAAISGVGTLAWIAVGRSFP